MSRTKTARLVLSLALGFSGFRADTARAQALSGPAPPPLLAAPSTQAPPQKTAATALAEALAANPITAPYRLGTLDQKGKVVLLGRVGDSRVHDVAVRTAIAMGIPISDQLVIDTAAGYAVASQAAGPWGAGAQGSVVSSYTYPPPLFGRYDDPFFGLEPPLVSYAPWWGAASGYRLAQDQPMAPAQPAGQPQPAQPEPPLPANTIEAAIDQYGVATLRGVVPTDAARVEIGQRLSRMPGISQVVNRLTIGPLANVANATAAPPRRVLDDNPPPPPTPSMVKPRPDPTEPAGQPIRIAPEPANPGAAPANLAGPTGRADRSIQERPELAGQGVKVTVRDGTASLSGRVPTVYEAMLAFRSVQQTPGVRDVLDSLNFTVPDGTTQNPLLSKAKPQDVEPYLEAQIRRQVGDSAHVDRVRLEGDQLVIQGTLEREDEKPRIEAILRSMPILRGFKILPEFRPLQR